jgi:hypothetical protein
MWYSQSEKEDQGPNFVANLKFDTKFFAGIPDIFCKNIFRYFI